MVSEEEHQQVLAEELEVLQSIYTDRELLRDEADPSRLSILVEPEEGVEGGAGVRLRLRIEYTPEYPDEPPNISVENARRGGGSVGEGDDEDGDGEEEEEEEDEEGQGDDDEDGDADDGDGEGGAGGKGRRGAGGRIDAQGLDKLRQELQQVAEESVGMAMVFTLASQLRDSLTALVQQREATRLEEESRKRDEEIEREAAKFRGTAVTRERFAEWRLRFDAERALSANRQAEERLRALSAKEREEQRRFLARRTGKQIFTQRRDEDGGFDDGYDEAEVGSDAAGAVVEVDISQYSKEERERQRREEEEREEVRQRLERQALLDSDEE